MIGTINGLPPVSASPSSSSPRTNMTGFRWVIEEGSSWALMFRRTCNARSLFTIAAAMSAFGNSKIWLSRSFTKAKGRSITGSWSPHPTAERMLTLTVNPCGSPRLCVDFGTFKERRYDCVCGHNIQCQTGRSAGCESVNTVPILIAVWCHSGSFSCPRSRSLENRANPFRGVKSSRLSSCQREHRI